MNFYAPFNKQQRNKIPEEGSAGFACAPLLWNFISLLSPNADHQNEKVVVHCSGEIGRTGHILAAWLVAGRGLSPKSAIAAVHRTGRNPSEAIIAAPFKGRNPGTLLRLSTGY